MSGVENECNRAASKIRESTRQSMDMFLRYKVEENFLNCNNSLRKNFVDCQKKMKEEKANLESKNIKSFASVDHDYEDFGRCMEKLRGDENSSKTLCLEIYEKKITQSLNDFMSKVMT